MSGALPDLRPAPCRRNLGKGRETVREISAAELGGITFLADRLYCVFHDDTSGTSRLSPGALGLALGAGLLCELTLGAHVLVDQDGCLRSISHPQYPPSSRPTTFILNAVQNEQPFRIREWLEYLATDATQMVAQRMVGDGYLNSETGRNLLRQRQVTYRPHDWGRLAVPAARIRKALADKDLPEWADMILCAIVRAVGLGDRLCFDDESASYMNHLIAAQAKLCPTLHYIALQTEALVGGNVATGLRR